MRVLVVDDVGFSRNVVARLLGGAGYEVVTAESGHQALQRLQNDAKFQLVITDEKMPGMDGTQLYAACKSELGDATPHFILLTASNDVDAMKAAKALGFIDVLIKPFAIDRFHQTLKTAGLEAATPPDA